MKDNIWRPADQPDWETCIAWRRMLLAALFASWDAYPPISLFIRQTRSLTKRRAPSCVLPQQHDFHRAESLLNESQRLLFGRFYYESCLRALDARVICESPEDSSESLTPEDVGWYLCACFRDIFPDAPPGFERIGRSGGRK